MIYVDLFNLYFWNKFFIIIRIHTFFNNLDYNIRFFIFTWIIIISFKFIFIKIIIFENLRIYYQNSILLFQVGQPFKMSILSMGNELKFQSWFAGRCLLYFFSFAFILKLILYIKMIWWDMDLWYLYYLVCFLKIYHLSQNLKNCSYYSWWKIRLLTIKKFKRIILYFIRGLFFIFY